MLMLIRNASFVHIVNRVLCVIIPPDFHIAKSDVIRIVTSILQEYSGTSASVLAVLIGHEKS